MLSFRDVAMWIACAVGLLLPGSAAGQEMSGEYKSVLTTLGKTGDFKDGVLNVTLPKSPEAERGRRIPINGGTRH